MMNFAIVSMIYVVVIILTFCVLMADKSYQHGCVIINMNGLLPKTTFGLIAELNGYVIVIITSIIYYVTQHPP